VTRPGPVISSPYWRMATSVGLGALIIGTLLMGPLSTPAQAAFSAPVPLSATDVVGAKATIDPLGNVIVVWSKRGAAGWRVQARLISSTGTLGPVKALSAGAKKPLWPQIATDNFDYGAIVVWSQPSSEKSRIKARRIGPHGRLGPVKNLSGRRRLAGLRIASRGDYFGAIVVWSQAQRRTWRIKARKVTSTRHRGPVTPGPVKTLSGARHNSKDPEIGSDESGHAVVVWSQRGGPSSRIKTLSGPVKARKISVNGRLSPVKTLSDPGRGAGEAQVAVDDRRAIAVWSQTNSKGVKPRVKARRIGGFAPRGVMNLSTKNSGDPDVGTGVHGDATVIWDTTRGTKGRVQARQFSPRSGPGPVQALSAPGGSANSPQVGTNFSGDSTVVWYVFQASGEWPVQARRISAEGKLGRLQTIWSASGIRQPQIAVNGGGSIGKGAFAVWSQLDGSTWRICGSLGPN
jgi:hypothetical protein